MTIIRALAVLAAVGLLACGNVPIGADHADAGGDAGPGSVSCTTDNQCMTDVDFCASQCGVCRAVNGPPPIGQVGKCAAPSGVRCTDACAGVKAICRAGTCVIQ